MRDIKEKIANISGVLKIRN